MLESEYKYLKKTVYDIYDPDTVFCKIMQFQEVMQACAANLAG